LSNNFIQRTASPPLIKSLDRNAVALNCRSIAKYKEYRVEEYIVVDPVYNSVEQFFFSDDQKTLPTTLWLEQNDVLKLLSLSLEIPLRDIFYPQQPASNEEEQKSNL
jgi:hypothetical protein